MPEGYARLPGAGYEALHPELKDVNPEDYPDIHKMAILADVAPYSREYHTYRQKIGKQAQGNTELEIEYEKILKRVKQTRESVIRMQDRHFTEPVDEISGTVEEASPGGVTLKEYPGRLFQFSSVSTSAADMSARILGENNNMTRSFRPATPKAPRARGPDRSRTSLIRASPLPGTLMLFKAGKLEWSSPSCRTKKASCAHTPDLSPIHDPASHRPGSLARTPDRNPVHDRGPRLFLAPSPCLGGQARVGLSVLP